MHPTTNSSNPQFDSIHRTLVALFFSTSLLVKLVSGLAEAMNNDKTTAQFTNAPTEVL